ncbi:MAG: DUF1622 domain-containing protein [Halanaerobiales bacterium]
MFTEIVSYYTGYIGIAVIFWGVIVSLLRFVNYEYFRLVKKDKAKKMEILRYKLGIYLLLGLEFLIAADVMRTIAEPTFEELGKLGGVVLIRTVINYFLDMEVSGSC